MSSAEMSSLNPIPAKLRSLPRRPLRVRSLLASYWAVALYAHEGAANAKNGQLWSVSEFLRELWGSTMETIEKTFSSEMLNADVSAGWESCLASGSAANAATAQSSAISRVWGLRNVR